MRKELITHFIHNTIRSQAVGGTIAILDLTPEGAETGKRLAMGIEIESSDKDNEIIIEELAQELGQQFYSAPIDTVEYAFENALAKANIAIKDRLLTKPKNWLTKIHIVVIAAKDEEVHLTAIGNMRAFLIHHDRIVDILGNTASRERAWTPAIPNPVKLFSNIVSGSLHQGSGIIMLNDSVLDYLSPERIRKSVSESEPKESIAQLTQLLEKAPLTRQFCVALIKRMPGFEPAIEPITQPEPDATPEYATDQLEYLRPDQTERLATGRIEYAALTKEGGKLIARYAQLALTQLLAGLSKLLEYLQAGMSRLIPALARLPKIIKTMWQNRSARTYHWSKIKEQAKQLSTSSQGSLLALSRSKKYALLAIGILLVIFVGNISLRARNNATVAVESDFAGRQSVIEQKINEAEAALIYKNTARAREVLGATTNLIDQLAADHPEKAELLTELRSKITALSNRSQQKKVLEGLEPFVTIIPSPITVRETGLIAAGKNIYYYDGVQERLALVDTQNRLLLSLSLENQGLEAFSTAVYLTEDTVAAIAPEKVLFINTKDETISKQRFTYIPNRALPFTSYARNLYTLAPDTKEIVRYRRAGAGFTDAQTWIQEPYDFTNMVDIAVDGFIYTLENTGDIHAFLKGAFNKKIDFPAPDRPGTGVRFYTAEGLDTFYILDPANRRVIRVQKDGELLIQYIAEQFKDATSVVADIDDKNVYVLAQDKIYRISTD